MAMAIMGLTPAPPPLDVAAYTSLSPRVRTFRGRITTHVGRPRCSRATDCPGQVAIDGGRRPGSLIDKFRRRAPHRRATSSLHLRHSCHPNVGRHETVLPRPRWQETMFPHGKSRALRTPDCFTTAVEPNSGASS